MHFVRRAVLSLALSFLGILLFTTAIVVGLTSVSQPPTVKQVLADSGIYNSALDSLLDQTKQISTDTSNIPLKDPAIRAAAEKDFSPQFIRSSSETVIDSVYNWLNGKTSQPDFKVDLSGQRAKFAADVGHIAAKRASKLPRCNSFGSVDPFTATCLPLGVTAQQVGAQVRHDINSGKGFLDNPVITASTVKSSDSGKSVFTEQLKDVPEAYQHAKSAPIGLIILSLLLSLGIIFLSTTKRAGIRHIGVVLFIVGILTLSIAWTLSNMVSRDTVRKIKLDNAVLQKNVRTLVTDLSQKASQNYWWFGGIYTALGAGVITGTMFIGRDKQAVVTETSETKPETKAPKTRSPQAKAKKS